MNNGEPNESPPVPVLMAVWRLESHPLRICLDVGGLTFGLPLSGSAAQCLMLTILAEQPELGRELLPETAATILETAREYAERDQSFLESVGVTLADSEIDKEKQSANRLY